MNAKPTRSTSPAARSSVPAGVVSGMGAGALWGLVFLAPVLTPDFSPWQLSAGRYLCYGLMASALLASRRRVLLKRTSPSQWGLLAWLGLTGNTLYYVLLAAAVQKAGVATVSLVIGFLPVLVSLAGQRDPGAASLRRLLPSLLLCVAGAICIGWQALQPQLQPQQRLQHLFGLACAVAALMSWTVYAVSNARALARLQDMTAHDWNLLTGVATGVQGLLLAVPALLLDQHAHAGHDWLRLGGVALVVAILASIMGNSLWNRMSRLLPLTLVGQMILFETLFAMAYGLLWARRWPHPLETLALALVIASVLASVSAHRTPITAQAAG